MNKTLKVVAIVLAVVLFPVGAFFAWRHFKKTSPSAAPASTTTAISMQAAPITYNGALVTPPAGPAPQQGGGSSPFATATAWVQQGTALAKTLGGVANDIFGTLGGF